jgi:polyisoprenoid-binding protein YceI
LNLKGIALPVTVAAEIRIGRDSEQDRFVRADVHGEAVLRRLDFNVGTGDWKRTDVIANEVRVRVRIVARRPA